MNKAERSKRWEQCQEYIRRTKTLDEAMAAGKRDSFRAPTSAWINAWGKLKAKEPAP